MVCYVGLLAFRHLGWPCRPGIRQSWVQIFGPGTLNKSLGPTPTEWTLHSVSVSLLELPQRNRGHAVPGQEHSLRLTTICSSPTRGVAGTSHSQVTSWLSHATICPPHWVLTKAGRDIWGAEPSATSLPWAQRMLCCLCGLGRLFLSTRNSFHKKDCLFPVAFSERRMESSRISLNLLTVPTVKKLV